MGEISRFRDINNGPDGVAGCFNPDQFRLYLFDRLFKCAVFFRIEPVQFDALILGQAA